MEGPAWQIQAESEHSQRQTPLPLPEISSTEDAGCDFQSLPRLPSLQPWPFFYSFTWKYFAAEISEQKRLYQKRRSDWCIMQHPVTTRELDFDMLAEVCYFYSGTWWSIPCQHLYNIKYLHPYGECIIKACCIQLWKLSHIFPKLHCNPQMRAGSQNGKSLA